MLFQLNNWPLHNFFLYMQNLRIWNTWKRLTCLGLLSSSVAAVSIEPSVFGATFPALSSATKCAESERSYIMKPFSSFFLTNFIVNRFCCKWIIRKWNTSRIIRTQDFKMENLIQIEIKIIRNTRLFQSFFLLKFVH